MRKLCKKLLSVLCAALVMTSSLGLVACGKGADGETTLEVNIWDAGYGYKWLEQTLDAFKEEDWVKSKYPNLEIICEADGSDAYKTKIDAGERSNTVDLFFGSGLDSYFGKDVNGKEFFADLTETVFNKTVPGENITVKDKMLPTYVDSIRYYEKGQDSNSPDVPFKSYTFPWASGMDGILYNADHLESMDLEVPLTTDQFIEYCKKISDGKYFDYNNKEYGDYAILRDAGGAYWEYIYPTWWAQYEGVEAYRNFFNGVTKVGDDYRFGPEIFEQKGKLYALTAFEEILKWDNGYVYKKNAGLDFMQAQTNFLKGEGVFYANGDWFSREMETTAAAIKKEYGIEYDIRMMRVPVISDIIERTPTITNDETLRSVIRCIDAGFATVQAAKSDPTNAEMNAILNVSEADYAIIVEARGMIHAIGPTHHAVVPSYAKGKEVAFDFLTYLATDKAQEIYLEYTGGASLPFDYDLQRKNPTLYSKIFEGEGKKIYQVEKDRLSFLYDQCYESNVLPDPRSFPLVKWGGMSAIYSLGGHSTVSYFANKGASGSAREVYENDIAYYKTGGQFNTCVDKAGLN